VIEIALLNRSTVVADGTLDVITAALNLQLTNDFGPAEAWGIEANVTFVPRGAPDPVDSWWVAVFDNADVANALGYHDVTSSGSPLGKVFAATDLYFGTALSVTVGHEVLEMLADPNIEHSVRVGDLLSARNLRRRRRGSVCLSDRCRRRRGALHGFRPTGMVPAKPGAGIDKI